MSFPPAFFLSGGGDLLLFDAEIPVIREKRIEGYAQHDLDLFIRSPVHFPCPTCSKPSSYLSFVRILDCHRTLVGTSSSPGVEIGPTIPVSLAGTCSTSLPTHKSLPRRIVDVSVIIVKTTTGWRTTIIVVKRDR